MKALPKAAVPAFGLDEPSVTIDRVAAIRPIDTAAVKDSRALVGRQGNTGTFSFDRHPLVGCFAGAISEKQDEPAREYQ